MWALVWLVGARAAIGTVVAASIIAWCRSPLLVAFEVAQVFHEVGAVLEHVAALLRSTATTIATAIMTPASVVLRLVAIELRATATRTTTVFERGGQKLSGKLADLDAIACGLPQ